MVLTCLVSKATGQPVVKSYFDSNGEPATEQGSLYYSIGKKNNEGHFYDSLTSWYTKTRTLRSIEIRDKFGSPTGDYQAYYPNGILKMKGRFEKKLFKIFQSSPDSTELSIALFNDSLGHPQVKDHNGFVHGRPEFLVVKGKIVNGLKDSVWTTFYNNGRILCHESWHDGELIDGISYDNNGKDYYYKSILVLPEPSDGTQGFYDRMGDEINYPKEAQKRGIEGKITASFTVEKNGTISSPKVIKGLGYGTDEEVLRIISLSKPWIPAMLRGQKIRREVTLPFVFKLK